MKSHSVLLHTSFIDFIHSFCQNTIAQGMSIKYTDMKTCFKSTYLETYLSKSILYYGCLCSNAVLMLWTQHVTCSTHVTHLKILQKKIIFTYVDSIHYLIRQSITHPLSHYDHCVATARCQWIKISFNAKKTHTFNIEQVKQLTVITKQFMQPACMDFWSCGPQVTTSGCPCIRN